jgi:hypothetical protein
VYPWSVSFSLLFLRLRGRRRWSFWLWILRRRDTPMEHKIDNRRKRVLFVTPRNSREKDSQGGDQKPKQKEKSQDFTHSDEERYSSTKKDELNL